MSHAPIIHVPTAESDKPPPAIRRCAIYARVSVSSQDSNTQLTSLQAQVQACENFIQSQRSMGWELAAPPYIDDGYSGGTLDRPDHLSRSSPDFGQCIGTFYAPERLYALWFRAEKSPKKPPTHPKQHRKRHRTFSTLTTKGLKET